MSSPAQQLANGKQPLAALIKECQGIPLVLIQIPLIIWLTDVFNVKMKVDIHSLMNNFIEYFFNLKITIYGSFNLYPTSRSYSGMLFSVHTLSMLI